jgi:hypothetical protein
MHRLALINEKARPRGMLTVVVGWSYQLGRSSLLWENPEVLSDQGLHCGGWL